MGKNQTHKSMQMAKHASRGGGGGPEDVDTRYAGDPAWGQWMWVPGSMHGQADGPCTPVAQTSQLLLAWLQATTRHSTRLSGTRRAWRR